MSRDTNVEDLLVAFSIVESGLLREAEPAIEFARGLRAGQLPEGISISPTSLYRELYSAGKGSFFRLNDQLRRVLCKDDKPSEVTANIGTAVTGIAELVAQQVGLPPGVAAIVSEICLNIGLNRFCSAKDIDSLLS